MPITLSGDPPPKAQHRWVLPALLLLIAVVASTPFVVVRYHNSIIEKNQNAVIDALREYARQQAAFFAKEHRFAQAFDELGGDWAHVRDAVGMQPTEYFGYRFRSFRVTDGYALIAIPASYGYTGRMTFFVSNPGDKLYYHDLGVKTDTSVRAIDQYYVPPGAGAMKGM